MPEDPKAREARETARARARVAEVKALLARPPANPYTHCAVSRSGAVFSIHYDQASAEQAARLIKGTVRPWTPNESETR